MRPPFEKLFTRDYLIPHHLLDRTMKAMISCYLGNLAREDEVQPCIMQVYVLRKAGPPAAMAHTTVNNMRAASYLQNDSPVLSSLTKVALLLLIGHETYQFCIFGGTLVTLRRAAFQQLLCR